MGADLVEEWPVSETQFDRHSGLWTVYKENTTDTYKARVCVQFILTNYL